MRSAFDLLCLTEASFTKAQPVKSDLPGLGVNSLFQHWENSSLFALSMEVNHLRVSSLVKGTTKQWKTCLHCSKKIKWFEKKCVVREVLLSTAQSVLV